MENQRAEVYVMHRVGSSKKEKNGVTQEDQSGSGKLLVGERFPEGERHWCLRG